jgi:hypothetical protein
MEPVDLELHDAVLKGMRVNFTERSTTLLLDAYLLADAKVRRALEVDFLGVEDLSLIAALAAIADNSRAGNINYWLPKTDAGTTYVYLNDGCISVRAAAVHVRIVEGFANAN